MPILETTIYLKEIQCGSCGVFHAIPKAMYDTCLEEGGFWQCPNGHSRGFRDGKREREAVKRERDSLKQRVAQLEDEARAATDRANKSDAEAKRLKRRAKAGTCPCCKRTFSNMAEHMRKQHPAFDENVVALNPKKRKSA